MRNGFKYFSDQDKNFIYIDEANKKALVYNTGGAFTLTQKADTKDPRALSPLMYRLLVLLVKHPNVPYSRDAIASAISGGGDAFTKAGGYSQQTNYLSVMVSRLRSKLGPVMAKTIKPVKDGYVYDEQSS